VQRNYRTFLMFIYSTSIYIAWTFGVSLGSLFVRHKELAAAVEPATQDSISSNLWLQTLGAWLALMTAAGWILFCYFAVMYLHGIRMSSNVLLQTLGAC
jgi:palmitoyltransferase ZDHHC9/14/18